MIDVEPLLREELEQAIPACSSARADWGEVRRRAGTANRSRGRRLLGVGVVAAVRSSHLSR